MSSEWSTPPAAPPPVVNAADPPPLPKRAPSRGGPKWEADAKARVRDAIRRYSKPLADLIARDANEADTRLLVTDFLCDALGYDKYADLSTEYRVKGEFADYGIRIDKQLVAFLEVKRVTTKLGAKHLRQVQMYAVNEGVEWVILTNGAAWQVWHLSGGLPVVMDLVLDVDLSAEGSPTSKAAQLFYLTAESMKRRQVDEVWQQKRATSPESIAKALRSDAVLDSLRKELRRDTGHNVPTNELRDILEATVLRPECLN